MGYLFGKLSLFFIMFFVVCTICFAVPTTIFNTPPTPVDSSTQTSRDVIINVSVTETNLETFTFNWDNNNYTFYNDSLVLMYNFDSYNALSDFSQGSHSGTAFGTATYSPLGRYNGAYDFLGGDDYVRTSLWIPPSGAFSVCAWIKPDSVNSNEIFGFANYYNGNIHDRELAINTDGKLEFYVFNIQPYSAVGTTVFQVGQWYYVCGVIDTILGNLVYVNGNLEDTQAGGTNGFNEYGGTAYGFIGAKTSTFGNFNGLIDEVRVWDRTLSQIEISEYYNSNFRKHAINKWEYISEKEGLAYATFEYQAFSSDTGGVFGNTLERSVTISSGSGIGSGVGVSEFSSNSFFGLISLVGIFSLFFLKQ